MSRNAELHRLFHEVAARRGGVGADRHFRAVGIPASFVRTRIREGTASRMMPSITAVGPLCHEPTHAMRCHGGVLHAGDDASLDGATGAAQLELWNRKVDTIHVVSSGHVRPVPGYVFHEAATRWDAVIMTAETRCPISGVMDLCVRMAMTHKPWQVAFVIRKAMYHGLIDLAALRGVVDVRRGQRGNAVLRAAIEFVDSDSHGTRSTSEDIFLEDMLGEGVEMPQVNVKGALGIARDEPDFVWRDRGIVRNIEVDGPHHDQEPQRSDDERRDRDAMALGADILRVPTRLLWKHRRRTIRLCMHFLQGGHVDVEPGTRRLLL